MTLMKIEIKKSAEQWGLFCGRKVIDMTVLSALNGGERRLSNSALYSGERWLSNSALYGGERH